MTDDVLDNQEGVKKQRKSRELELLTIRQVMKTENGRAFMWRCLQNCMTFDNIFHQDATVHAYNAGAREHGLWLERELKEAAPEDYIKMRQEHVNE